MNNNKDAWEVYIYTFLFILIWNYEPIPASFTLNHTDTETLLTRTVASLENGYTQEGLYLHSKHAEEHPTSIRARWRRV
jgi:hypothetical protein